MKHSFIVAVDGPAASGKSTLGKALAGEFGLEFVESGSFYRFVTLWLLRRRVPLNDLRAVRKALRGLNFSYAAGVHHDGSERIDDTALRSRQVDDTVSLVSLIPEVRRKVNNFLRFFAEGKKLIVDGRDIGTAVFPEADLKIFLQASLEKRRKRRAKQLGSREAEEEIESNISLRDRLDSTREIAPLKPAHDAILIDNSCQNLEETLALIYLLLKEKLDEP